MADRDEENEENGDAWFLDLDAKLDKYAVGSQISAPAVRVIAADGRQLGVLPIAEALRRAADAGLDLVEVNPRANPPVCKIMNYAQFRRSLRSSGSSN